VAIAQRKEMPVILVYKVVDSKRIFGNKGRGLRSGTRGH
jgi:hypothetical protein